MKSLLLIIFVFSTRIILAQTLLTSPAVKQLATSEDHSLALLADGTIWAWGNNGRGQLGTGSTNDKTSAVKVGTDSSWCSITASNYFSHAVKKDGTLWGWGDNKVGQLGISTANIIYSYKTPVQIGTDNDWQAVSSGDQFTIGLKKDGTIWAWGNNLNHLQHTEGNAYKPVKLAGADNSNWLAIAAGEDFFIAQKKDGSLFTKGMINERLHNSGGKKVFFKVSDDKDWTSFSAGARHAVAIKKNGSLWAWGANESGQLGNGNNSIINEPIRIGTEHNWEKVAAAGNLTFALKKDGSAWYWGQAFFKNEIDTYFAIPKPLTSDKTYSYLTASSKIFLLSLQEEKLRGVVEDYKEAYGQEKTIKMFIKY